MNLRVLLVFLLLALLTTEVHSWWSRRRRSRPAPRSSTGGGSPAGGPAGNPNAVLCNHYRSSNSLTCTKGSSSVSCTTKPPVETDDRSYGGPTPRGEYLIGKRYPHPSSDIDWYNLYPKKEDSSGYYGYTQSTQTGRYAMGLHPGEISLGCVTVWAQTYNSDACWQRIRKVIDSGNMYYRRSSYSGFLFVS